MSFTFSISLCSFIVLIMFFNGASVNESESIQRDLLLKHWLTLDELINNSKLINNSEISESNEESLELLNRCSSMSLLDDTNLNRHLLMRLINQNKEYNPHKLTSSMEAIVIIRKKLKSDNIVAPLKIFWIKTDYYFFSRLVALGGTATSLVLGNAWKNLSLKGII